MTVKSSILPESRWKICAAAIVVVLLGTRGAMLHAEVKRPPNVIVILADDLGYGELGCYGQRLIRTPRLDQMAVEGLRFTHFYAGATVCAPSRSVLMTGLHHGHTRVRGNAGRTNPEAQALQPDDSTVAELAQQSGYRTALIGKWGLGDIGPAETGLPRKQGFDEFYGYLNQQHAHNHFPDFLWENEERTRLRNVVTAVGDAGAGYATTAVEFADDLFAERSLRFVESNRHRPFFLFWSMVTPHANNERTRALKNGAQVPDFGPWSDAEWPEPDRGHAAMITRLDMHVGRMLDRLRELGIAEETLVLFSSDNGPHNESGHNPERFQPAGPYTGMKRSLTDGGIRVPLLAWWPGTIAAGGETARVAYHGDLMATVAEVAGVSGPQGLDSISLVPTLKGEPARSAHEFLYWEFHEGGFRQACLYRERWKGIRIAGGALRLYDTDSDIAERRDIAAANPDIARVVGDYLDHARTDSIHWQPQRPQ